MKRKPVYYVENQLTRGILDTSGGWTRLTGYTAAKFNTKDAATAAFPAGVKCEVVIRFEEVGE